MKHRRCEPGSGVSSSRSKNLRSMRGRIPKVPIFLALRNQHKTDQANSQNDLLLTELSASPSVFQEVAPAAPTTQNKRSSDRNHISPSYYGFDVSPSDSTNAALPKQPRRAGDIENYQPPSVSVVEFVQTTEDQLPKVDKISSKIGEVSPHNRRLRSLVHQQTPTLDEDIKSMTVYGAENQEILLLVMIT